MGEDALKGLLPFFILTGCATTTYPVSALTVDDVWERHHELDGKLIRVEGLVTRCYALGCQLLESAEEEAKSLGIGTSARFDSAVVPFLGRRIVVEAILDSECLHAYADEIDPAKDAFVICTDRSSMLVNPRLIGPVS